MGVGVMEGEDKGVIKLSITGLDSGMGVRRTVGVGIAMGVVGRDILLEITVLIILLIKFL